MTAGMDPEKYAARLEIYKSEYALVKAAREKRNEKRWKMDHKKVASDIDDAGFRTNSNDLALKPRKPQMTAGTDPEKYAARLKT
jgi:hypothetical protein